MLGPATTIVYVTKARNGRQHVFYANKQDEMVSTTLLRESMTAAGVYCLNVWPAANWASHVGVD